MMKQYFTSTNEEIFTMVDIATDSKERTTTRRWIWVTMILYLIPFPFLLYGSLFSVAILNPSGSRVFQMSLILLFLSIPLSIPISIYFMWRRYFQKQYSAVLFYFVLPIIVIVVCYYLIKIMEFLFFVRP